MDWITLIPAIFLAIYGSIRVFYRKGRKVQWGILLGVAMTVVIWSVLCYYFGRKLAAYIIIVVLVVLLFELLQVRKHRMAPTFHILYCLTVALIVGSTVKFPEIIPFGGYLLLLIYLLMVSNQHYIKKTYEDSAVQYQNKILTQQVNEVQNIYMTMRGWRHDYHNHLQTLKAHLKMNQVEEAEIYLGKLEADLDQVNQLIESGNVNLDAILNSKLSLALKSEIEIHFKAEVPAALAVSDIDLCVLIGNLIDNAVEACDKMTDQAEKRFIRLYIGVLKKQLYISVMNSTKEAVRKLDEEYITTKRGNHGHGLKRINKIVEKYEGFINRKNEPGVFVTEIMLPL